MGWGFRKRIRLFPGLHLNISKNGISLNIGPRGFNVSLGGKGVTLNTGIPGSGLYSRHTIVSKKEVTSNTQAPSAQVSHATCKRENKEQVYVAKETLHYDISSPLTITHAQEEVLSFASPDVINELKKAYAIDLINVCQHIVYSKKCVLSNIQAEFEFSHQKVTKIVNILEKALIIKQEGNRRIVMACDEDVAIRLLLRYHDDNSSPLDLNFSTQILEQLDPMFDEIARYVVIKQEGSSSRIQRAFNLTYNRAGRIVDQLEAAKIVGYNMESKGREVLIQNIDELENKLKELKR